MSTKDDDRRNGLQWARNGLAAIPHDAWLRLLDALKADAGVSPAQVLEQTAGAPLGPAGLLIAARLEAGAGNFREAERLARMVPEPEAGRPDVRRMIESAGRGEAWPNPGYIAGDVLNGLEYRDYPKAVAVEFGSYCNGRCVFCPHSALERRNQDMPDGLFEKIVDDLTAVPRDRRFILYTNVVNEPFLDKKLFERLALVNEKLPNADIVMFSNLAYLPARSLEKLRGIRNLKEMNVSLNSVDGDEYKSVMGLNFERTIGNLRSLLEENRERGVFEKPVVLNRVRLFNERDDTFRHDCVKLLAEFEPGRDFNAVTCFAMDWLGDTDNSADVVPVHHPCPKWYEITVFSNGIVPFCCMDAHGRFALGNALEQSLLDIYNSPAWKAVRANVERAPVRPCNKCSLV